MPDSRGPEPPDGLPEFGEDPEHADDELSSVVFDEHFVRAAQIHEPSALERLLAAAPPAAEAPEPSDGVDAADFADGPDDPFPLVEPRTSPGFRPDTGIPVVYGPDEEPTSGRTSGWRQSVAWVLALLMGIGVVAIAITAVAPGRSGQTPPAPQPTVGSPVPRPEVRTPGSTASGPTPAAAAGGGVCNAPLRDGC
ncbi:hypothetical protein [Yinghuangia sp. YIM S09857]|uniref:SCO2584 family spore wall biosynthesis protein n=1 Tax=Yinghuangia sp. YIM S09857 TaxID=3436929 RepID=UPI003F53AE7B